jgi:hypothetical protein
MRNTDVSDVSDVSKILGSHGGEYEDDGLLGNCAV